MPESNSGQYHTLPSSTTSKNGSTGFVVSVVEDVPEPEPEEPKEPSEPKQHQETFIQNLDSVVEPVKETVPALTSPPVEPVQTPAPAPAAQGDCVEADLQPEPDAADVNDDGSGRTENKREEETHETDSAKAANICEHQDGMTTQQEPKTDKDNEYCRKVNEYLNNPPMPGAPGSGGGSGHELSALGVEGGLQNLLGNMSHNQLMQLIGPTGLGGLVLGALAAEDQLQAAPHPALVANRQQPLHHQAEPPDWAFLRPLPPL
ncbi:protein VASP homolog isoform X2 [Trachinotus anak]|uniref:protein VASP homolog isoform X2 n=1 Tax=Trachinotus anak TaxID=443729 RepID=UPI0039F1D178